MSTQNPLHKVLRTLSSVKTGVFLLILVVIASAIGTIVLQRPITDADQVERTYSPTTLVWLDRLGFTDVFHSWWFAILMALVAVSIILVSIDRFPRAWKVLTRPYKQTDSHFRAVLPIQERIPVPDAAAALSIADNAFRKSGLRPERVGSNAEPALYAERNRYSVLAVYVIHASLLMIFMGGIIDAVWGYKGFIMLKKGESVSEMELSDKRIHKLPYTIRFDTGARENYSDGSPKQWWSHLTVFENGQEVQKKKIEVNDPLVRDGIRFFQSSFGNSEDLDHLTLAVKNQKNPAESKEITLAGTTPVQLDADTTVKIETVIPDFVIRDNQIYKRSSEFTNPAIELSVVQKGQAKSAWLFPSQPNLNQTNVEGYEFAYRDAAVAPFTGLQVSYEPGQWAVWAGCILMALGLGMAFYCVHRRYWAVVVNDPKLGQALWIGSQADKNREHFAEEFKTITANIRGELQLQASVTREERSLASV
ncbi:MAG TPA: cytochrome c biogenesis protein ResB [Terriglobales bacterium]|nr:cytochrome c biogenesis protein ResB [Terriglobales bacterium]